MVVLLLRQVSSLEVYFPVGRLEAWLLWNCLEVTLEVGGLLEVGVDLGLAWGFLVI